MAVDKPRDALHAAVYPKPQSAQDFAEVLSRLHFEDCQGVQQIISEIGQLGDGAHSKLACDLMMGTRPNQEDIRSSRTACMCLVVGAEAALGAGMPETASMDSSLALKLLDALEAAQFSGSAASISAPVPNCCAAMQPFLGGFFKACALDSSIVEDKA